MKRILLSTASLGIMALMSPALAADLPLKAPSATASVYDWTGALLASVGYAVDRWLLYFDGGYAFGDIQHTNTPLIGPVDRFNVTGNGLTGGAGIAYAVTNNVIAKFDYRYTSFTGYNRPGSTITGLTVNGQLPYSTVSTYSVVTLGLDFKFGGPVVAKY